MWTTSCLKTILENKQCSSHSTQSAALFLLRIAVRRIYTHSLYGRVTEKIARNVCSNHSRRVLNSPLGRAIRQTETPSNSRPTSAIRLYFFTAFTWDSAIIGSFESGWEWWRLFSVHTNRTSGWAPCLTLFVTQFHTVFRPPAQRLYCVHWKREGAGVNQRYGFGFIPNVLKVYSFAA